MDDLFLVRVYLTQHAVRPQQSLTVTNAAYTQRSNSSESCLEMEIKEEEEKLEILDIATWVGEATEISAGNKTADGHWFSSSSGRELLYHLKLQQTKLERTNTPQSSSSLFFSCVVFFFFLLLFPSSWDWEDKQGIFWWTVLSFLYKFLPFICLLIFIYFIKREVRPIWRAGKIRVVWLASVSPAKEGSGRDTWHTMLGGQLKFLFCRWCHCEA